MFCSTSIVRRNMRRLDAECRRCEAREISKQSDRLGVPPWWCDRTRYPDEPARIAREIMQGVIHLKPIQHDPSRGLGGPCGPHCRQLSLPEVPACSSHPENTRNLIDWGSRHGGVTAPGTKMNQLGLRGRARRAPSIINHLNTIALEGLEDPIAPSL